MATSVYAVLVSTLTLALLVVQVIVHILLSIGSLKKKLKMSRMPMWDTNRVQKRAKSKRSNLN
jgi:hypothetical protein